jgi:hypothetical protein
MLGGRGGSLAERGFGGNDSPLGSAVAAWQWQRRQRGVSGGGGSSVGIKGAARW